MEYSQVDSRKWILSLLILSLAACTPFSSSVGEGALEQKKTSVPLETSADRPNICGISIGSSEKQVIDFARSFRAHLEPGGEPFHPRHLVDVNGTPFFVIYGADKKVAWVAGPSFQLEDGTVLSVSETTSQILDKRKGKLQLVSDQEPMRLCDGATQGYKVGASGLLSIREDGQAIFSLGSINGWKIVQDDGLSWEMLLKHLDL